LILRTNNYIKINSSNLDIAPLIYSVLIILIHNSHYLEEIDSELGRNAKQEEFLQGHKLVSKKTVTFNQKAILLSLF
jgi:hypothetical protein